MNGNFNETVLSFKSLSSLKFKKITLRKGDTDDYVGFFPRETQPVSESSQKINKEHSNNDDNSSHNVIQIHLNFSDKNTCFIDEEQVQRENMDYLNGVDEVQIYNENEVLDKSNNSDNIRELSHNKSSETIAKRAMSPILTKKNPIKSKPSTTLYKNSYKIKDKNMPYVYSVKDFHPSSFLSYQKAVGIDSKKLLLEAPSPVYIKYDVLIRFLLNNNYRQNLLKENKIDNKHGVELIDPEITNKFKGIISKMIKTAMASMFSKKNFSLPVKIFEPKSFLHRLADSMIEYKDFAKIFNQKNPIERFKQIISFAISGLFVSTRHLKPFNPLLGETFEAEISDKCKIYLEQISHYPTVARFYILEKETGVNLNGYFEIISKQKKLGSTVNMIQKGPVIIDFGKNDKVYYFLPKIKYINCKNVENRGIYQKGVMTVIDPHNGYRSIINFGKNDKSINTFQGEIFKTNCEPNYKFIYDNEKKLSKRKKNSFGKPVSSIVGNWLESLHIDGIEFWKMKSNSESQLKLPINPLPSDGRFREDLIWLFYSNLAEEPKEKEKFEEYSQIWKTHLEQRQRLDRELRKPKK